MLDYSKVDRGQNYFLSKFRQDSINLAIFFTYKAIYRRIKFISSMGVYPYHEILCSLIIIVTPGRKMNICDAEDENAYCTIIRPRMQPRVV